MGWPPPLFVRHHCAKLSHVVWRQRNEREESEMNATTVAVDLAKNVFELIAADAKGKVIERARLTRAQFERCFDNQRADLVAMEACGSAHHWARSLQARGIAVKLLPAQYVRAYVKR